jgi:hypothetical protein
MKRLLILKILLILGILIPMEVVALTPYTVPKVHHRIVLDGSLGEWKKDCAKTLGTRLHMLWDAVSVQEGLAGYFKVAPEGNKKTEWSFSFFPRNLSSYSKMQLSIPPAEKQSFYKQGADSLSAEWIIPWDSITVDSSGLYRVGIEAFDNLGDTLDPLILSGRVFSGKANASWAKVFSKGIFLVILLIFLFFLQKKAKINQYRSRSGNGRSPTRPR